MTKRMLIDAAHSEETRIAIVDGDRLENFDCESSSKQFLKGNIYLGKIARVEASLQAAFVDYGGDRHGFLPFSEIHPDYYRIPQEDRDLLIKEEARARREEALETDGMQEGEPEDSAEADGEAERIRQNHRMGQLRRKYKIQEVMKRRQIVLVQVTKEERGNKGAALTTYISLAGRYCVLMPNTGHGGGISRKITDASDRRKLKGIVEDLDVPEGMAIILRTAGVKRTKTEIKRDYDFLLRNWDRIREDTLSSTAPACIYEEADLVRRAIRDVYGRDIGEVVVEGEDAFRTAKEFMKVLMPSHARRVQQHKGESLFLASGIEEQLEKLHAGTVQLPSGGYLVIDSTEALVAVDVNSGRSTRERNIEETAVKTNLEAADEIARQLRLRDLAGLIVIDFIDMDDRRNSAQVERRLKEALKVDRAKVQVERIGKLGLLSMSRQRLRPSIFEASMERCPNCEGSGFVRSAESAALHAVRAIEQEALSGRHASLAAHLPTDMAFYLLNEKRGIWNRLEEANGVAVRIERDDTLVPGSWRLEGLEPREPAAPAAVSEGEAAAGKAGTDDDEPRRRRRSRRGGRRHRRDQEQESAADTVEAVPDGTPGAPAESVEETAAVSTVAAAETAAAVSTIPNEVVEASEGDGPETLAEEAEAAGSAKPKARRRRRRGSSAAQSGPGAGDEVAVPLAAAPDASERLRSDAGAAPPTAAPAGDPVAEAADAGGPSEEPKPRRRRVRSKGAADGGGAAGEADGSSAPPAGKSDPAPGPAAKPVPEPVAAEAAAAPSAPARRGWWQRLID